MIALLCITFFAIGYGYAVKKEAEFANEFIKEYMDTHICTEKTDEQYETIGYDFNFTQLT